MTRRSHLFWLLLTPLALAVAGAQEPRPAANGPLASIDTKTPPKANGFTPTWDTQKGARTHGLNIPAPRGQIVDRNGQPLAQTRVSYNLAINFPTPLTFTDAEVLRYAEP